MRGVKFGQNHSAEDWGLILNAKSLTPPVAKTTYISVEGRDGDLDLSETLTGEIRYKNRTASFTFLATEGSYTEREALLDEITSLVHGRRLNIITDDKSDYYLSGRCEIKERTNNKAYGTLKIDCNCDPWYYAVTPITRSFNISAETDIILVNNGRKTLTPDITVTGSITIAFNSTSVSLTAGTYKLTSLKLKSGNTPITLSGSGTVSFTYREGVL